ncbi:DUF4269 domain-containing protein [Tardiphaga sp. 839_C3_N1_4]|uniref:DUF4269 domain-containing protein n=1 Tax=Tardiphaga sp. 839_C3_N1_4 TaxID=3240761 RepID=UPI003F20EE8D
MNERLTYQEALRRTGLLGILEPFDPRRIGTLPLGVARPDSDIDIVCCAADLSTAVGLVWSTSASPRALPFINGRPKADR